MCLLKIQSQNNDCEFSKFICCKSPAVCLLYNMKVKNTHTIYNEALKNNSYRQLIIRRHGAECFLIIDVDGCPHVYVKKDGTPKKNRHVWQVKEWLNTKFGINTDDIEVRVSK